jgi:hypothetical protein
MRKRPQSSPQSEEAKFPDAPLKELVELRARIERLESEVFIYGVPALPSSTTKGRMGRKPKLETSELLNRRKHLTTWLEQNWPYLLQPLRTAKSKGDASIAISALIFAKTHGVSGVFQPPFYNDPERFHSALTAFLKSGRYYGNPRNLSAAMAGLPELKWKTSFDKCIAHPDNTGHMIEAYWDYMKRHFPQRLGELEKARTEQEVKTILSRSRTQDPLYTLLKDNPGKVKEWLEKGKPRKLIQANGTTRS